MKLTADRAALLNAPLGLVDLRQRRSLRIFGRRDLGRCLGHRGARGHYCHAVHAIGRLGFVQVSDVGGMRKQAAQAHSGHAEDL